MDGVTNPAAPQPIDIFIPKVDPDEITKFLNFLSNGKDNEIFTFCFLDSESEKSIKGYGCVHAKCQEVLDICNELLEKGVAFTLHVVLNRTNLRGSKIKDIVSARVLCADLDNAISADKIKELVALYRPGMVVQSSPGKYHLYWHLDCPINQWSKLQLGLAGLLGGDKNLAQLQHTIRVPGINRLKNGEMLMPKIVFLNPESEVLDHPGAISRFNGIELAAEKATDALREERRAVGRAIRDSRGTGNGLGKIDLKLDPQLGRNNFLYAYLREWIACCPVEPTDLDIQVEADKINAGFDVRIGEDELTGIVKKVTVKGLGAWKRRKEKLDKRKAIIDSVLVKQELPQNGHGSNGNNGESAECGDSADTADKITANGRFVYDFVNDPELRIAPYSDQGLIRRTIQRFGPKMRSTGSIVYGFHTENTLWEPQKVSHPMLNQFVETCANDLIREKPFIDLFCLNKDGTAESPEKAEKAKARFVSNNVISSTVSRLLHCKDIQRVEISDFDSRPELLFLANGLLNLDTLELRAALPSDLLLRRSKVRWEGIEADASEWVKFLSEIFEANEEPDKMIDFIQEIFGYTLSGHMDTQMVYIHYGGGSNGKSKVLRTLEHLLGEYCTLMGPSTMGKGKNGIAVALERVGVKLEGKRMVLIDDLDSKTVLNEGILKMLTGPKVTCRPLYQEERDIPNRAKFHIGCNTIPEPETQTFGTIRRLCVIPYLREFKPDGPTDKRLDKMIDRSLSGILAWAVRGYKRVMERGLLLPAEVEASAKEYKEQHFTAEKMVRAMYRGPIDATERIETIPIELLVEEVNKALKNASILEVLSKERLGKILIKINGITSVRIRGAKGPKVTQYQLVRVINEPNHSYGSMLDVLK